MPPKSNFGIGETVLCFHGPLLYEAKILKDEIKESKRRYFVHYKGWKNIWDEWIPESRVLKRTNANLQKQREVSKDFIQSKKNAKKKTAVSKVIGGKCETSVQEKLVKKEVVAKKSVTNKSKPSEEKTECSPKTEQKQLPKTHENFSKLNECKGKDNSENCDNISREIELKDRVRHFFEQRSQIRTVRETEIPEKIEIPSPLIDFLRKECDLVKNKEMILRLPAKYNVQYVLEKYLEEKVYNIDLPEPNRGKIMDFARNIQNCFDNLLGKTLLYGFERHQYLDVQKSMHGRMSEIYGVTHLLRLFCKMEELLHFIGAPPDEETLWKIHHFVRYMSENMHFFNESEYEQASPEYLKVASCS